MTPLIECGAAEVDLAAGDVLLVLDLVAAHRIPDRRHRAAGVGGRVLHAEPAIIGSEVRPELLGQVGERLLVELGEQSVNNRE